MTTYYFADSYSPTDLTAMTGTQPEWNFVMADASTIPVTLMNYALYDDTTIWDLWTAWAGYNRLTANTNDTDYSSLVIAISGFWPTLKTNDAFEDAMCIIDANSGAADGSALCVVTDKTNTSTKTYSCTKA